MSDTTPVDTLTLQDIGFLQELGIDGYKRQVLALFMSGRATPEQWAAMAEAVCHVSESQDGFLVVDIDRAIIAHVQRAQRR